MNPANNSYQISDNFNPNPNPNTNLNFFSNNNRQNSNIRTPNRTFSTGANSLLTPTGNDENLNHLMDLLYPLPDRREDDL